MVGRIHVQVDKKRIGVITIDHLPHNALPGYLLSNLADAIREMSEDPEIRVVLLKSAGDRTFCAGASFEEMASIQNEEAGKSFFMGFAEVILALRHCGKITVSRIHGKAVGGGVGLCSAVDYAIANKWASIRLSELTLGIGPFVIGPAVVRKIGISAFSALTLNPAEWKTASWAESNGLFHKVFDYTGEMDDYLEDFLEQYITYSPEALLGIKKMLWEETPSWIDIMNERAAQSGRLVLTETAQKAIQLVKNED